MKGERDKDSFELLAEDRCTLCGQKFIYEDIDELRGIDALDTDDYY